MKTSNLNILKTRVTVKNEFQLWILHQKIQIKIKKIKVLFKGIANKTGWVNTFKKSLKKHPIIKAFALISILFTTIVSFYKEIRPIVSI